MKVKVVNVVDTSFDGKDGTKVAAARLVYDLDGKQKALDTYIPPVATAALAWKPGDEVEIEEYQDKNGKSRFKTPQARGGGGGFKGLSFEERLRLDEAQSEAMDRRTALMQAVAFHEAGATEGTVMQTADKYLGWLRSQRTPESRQSVGVTKDSGSGGTAISTPPRSEAVPPSNVEAPAASGSTGGQVRTEMRTPETRVREDRGDNRAASDSPPASTSSSAGEDKRGTVPVEASGEEPAKPVGFGEGPRDAGSSSATLLEQAVELYGSKPRVLSAARMLHDWHSVDEIDEEDLRALIEKKAAVSA